MTKKRKIVLQRLDLTKADLLKFPERERTFLIYAGHISNEINWYNKHMLTLQRTGNDLIDKLKSRDADDLRAELDANAVQTMIVARALTLKTVEAGKFLAEWCLNEGWFRRLRLRFPPKGKDSLRRYRRYISNWNRNHRGKGKKPHPLYLMRNKFSSHYDSHAAILAAKECSLAQPFSCYLADIVGNTLYLGSERTVANSYVSQLSPGQLKRSFDRWIGQTIDVAGWIMDILGHSLTELVIEYLGENWDDYKFTETTVSGPDITSLSLPFYTSDKIS